MRSRTDTCLYMAESRNLNAWSSVSSARDSSLPAVTLHSLHTRSPYRFITFRTGRTHASKSPPFSALPSCASCSFIEKSTYGSGRAFLSAPLFFASSASSCELACASITSARAARWWYCRRSGYRGDSTLLGFFSEPHASIAPSTRMKAWDTLSRASATLFCQKSSSSMFSKRTACSIWYRQKKNTEKMNTAESTASKLASL
mmetsp:Transcript_1839/g.6392  ORF Transcript_1839/g.6392 Transcript_1839/m.6392 type:complete len:202 (+) Transcript_1839:212-817(+)